MAPRRAGTSRGGPHISVAPWLNRLRSAIVEVRAGRDSEGVHRLRVALGHLRVWLGMAGQSTLRAELRQLRKAAGPLRDLDVRLAQKPPGAEARRIETQRSTLGRELLTALEAAKSAVEAVAGLPALPTELVRAWTQVYAARVRLAGERWRPREGIAVTHAFRRQVRRLRYALEFLGAPTEGVAALQASLGTVCDSALARRALKHGHRRYRRRLMRRQHEAARLARRQWKDLRRWFDRLAAKEAP
jgi:CHAD domain-containing protein